MIIRIAALALALSASAQAQNFPQWLEQSRKDYRAADDLFKAKVADASAPPCAVLAAKFERNYADWYQQNAAQIEAIYRSFDSVIQYSNGKITELRSMSFRPVVDQGQQQNPNVTFQTAVDYIKNLSQRKKVAVESNQLAAFKVLIADAEANPFNLTLEQVVASLQGMSTLMNASLKERGVAFEIKFKETKDGYQLTLLVTMKDLQPIELDLLQGYTTLNLNDQFRWALVSGSKIGNYPVDAQLRYVQMARESSAKECLPRVKPGKANVPYASISSLPPLPKNGKITSLDEVLSGLPVLCALTDKDHYLIRFEGDTATILVWGGSRNGWAPGPVRREDKTVSVLWGSSYSSIWITQHDSGLSSSHGGAKCEYEF